MAIWNWIIIVFVVIFVPVGLAFTLWGLRRHSRMSPPAGWRDGEAEERKPMRWIGWSRTGGHG